MRDPRLTLAEALAEVEGLIEDFRWARGNPPLPEERTYRALKQIATDLRGRDPDAIPIAARELQRRVDAAIRSKTEHGYDANTLRTLGEELIGRWSTVQQALELLALGELIGRR